MCYEQREMKNFLRNHNQSFSHLYPTCFPPQNFSSLTQYHHKHIMERCVMYLASSQRSLSGEIPWQFLLGWEWWEPNLCWQADESFMFHSNFSYSHCACFASHQFTVVNHTIVKEGERKEHGALCNQHQSHDVTWSRNRKSTVTKNVVRFMEWNFNSFHACDFLIFLPFLTGLVNFFLVFQRPPARASQFLWKNETGKHRIIKYFPFNLAE